MRMVPRPGLDTRKISTTSRLRLKYCPSIRVAESRVIATPIPVPGVSVIVCEADLYILKLYVS